jgi:hypothetical protein
MSPVDGATTVADDRNVKRETFSPLWLTLYGGQ